MSERSRRITEIPPNEKTWDQDHRDAIHARLPGYMVLGGTADIRVGKWFPVEIGGSIRISRIPRERRAITAAFEDLGVEVGISLVGVSNEGDSTGSQAYKVEIENWIPKQQINEQE